MNRRELLKGLILAPLAVKLAPVLKFIPEPVRLVYYDEYAHYSEKQSAMMEEFRMDMDRTFLFGNA